MDTKKSNETDQTEVFCLVNLKVGGGCVGDGTFVCFVILLLEDV